MNRKTHHAAANHERWLISYADFITLLFAFFVVMFASSQADKNKAKKVSEAVERAFEGPPKTTVPAKATQSKEPPKQDQKPGLPNLEDSMRQLKRELEPEIQSGKMALRLEERGLTISLSQATFFPSGEDSIAPTTFDSIEKVAAALLRVPNPVRLEGHTDSRPIHTARYRSNWDLSAARAVAVLTLIRERWNLPASRFAVAGYADTVPVDTNDTDLGRGRNRRVDVVILSGAAAAAEPNQVNTLKSFQ